MLAKDLLLLVLIAAEKTAEKAVSFKEWFLSHGLRIVFIIIGYFVIIYFVKFLTKRFVRLVEDEDRSTRSERERRADTVSGIINTTTKIFLGIIVAFMILKEFNVNITPLLTGAGIAGIAIGFGAQSLIKDFLHGFFILVEDQFRVGDVVKIGDHAGLVERITMRVTKLRSLDGNVHVIPNGEITSLENMTHSWSRSLVDIEVAYKEDLDRVMKVIEEVAVNLSKEEAYKENIIEKPQVLGVQELGSSGITIRLLLKTVPMEQWNITRELYRRIKNRFDKEGITIPFPQMTLHGEVATKATQD
jgi:small-conductance mechanosensitive channel